MGLVLFDEIGFEGEGFGFGIGDNKFYIPNLFYHHLYTGVKGLGLTEIGTNPRSQFFGFTNVENFPIFVAHQINPCF